MLHVEHSDQLVGGSLLIKHLTFFSDVNDLLRGGFDEHLGLRLLPLGIFALDQLLSSIIHQVVL
jgi:hypothetical protein